jgi:hypothetical protein
LCAAFHILFNTCLLKKFPEKVVLAAYAATAAVIPSLMEDGVQKTSI